MVNGSALAQRRRRPAVPEAPRILVTGAAGQLGRALMALDWPAGVSLEGRTRVELDISNRASVDAAFAVPYDLVINAAAFTAVDRAESEAEQAFAINDTGVRNLADACARSGAAMIHVSTDYVFDGEKAEPYVEEDPVAPLGVYGRSKATGEAALRETLPRHVILRTAWVYDAQGPNFVKTMLRLGAERDLLRVVADQQGTPTAAGDLAAAIGTVAQSILAGGTEAAWGTYHCTNSGETNWHAFACEIFERAAPWLGRRPRVEAITTAEYPTPARRPANSRLDNGKLERSFGLRLRPWPEALDDTLAEIERSRTAH